MLTDAERIAYFERKKKETIDRLLGTEDKFPIPDAVETRVIDKNWTANKSWYDQPRILKNMNADTTGLREYQEQMHKNNGVVYLKMEETLKEIPPPVK